MSKYTPGPWTRKQPKGKYNVVANVRGIRVFGPYCATACVDDARLICAAPELLAACEAVLSSDMAMREEDEGQVSPVLAQLRAAIAKATGS